MMTERGFFVLFWWVVPVCEASNSLSVLVPSYKSECNLVPDVSQRHSVDYNCLDAGDLEEKLLRSVQPWYSSSE